MMHNTTEDKVLAKLKFVAKGEPKGVSKYGRTIPDVILIEEIKASADCVNYLMMSRNTQPCVPTQGMGRGKGYMRLRGVEFNVRKKRKAKVPRKKRTIAIVDNVLEDPKQALELVMSVNPKVTIYISGAYEVPLGTNVHVEASTVPSVMKTNPIDLFKAPTTSSETFTKYELKDKLSNMIFKTRSYGTHERHLDLYNALMNSIAIDMLVKGGPPGRNTIPTRYFFNNDLEYLKHRNKEKKYALSLSKLYAVEDKIHHLDSVDEFDLINAPLLYIRRIVIKRRVEDVHLGVESWAKKLNLTKPKLFDIDEKARKLCWTQKKGKRH
nr:hypothetical protein [Tanacetum cinerariifolium]